LFIEDTCDVKIGLIAKMDIVGALRALKPFRQLLLRTLLAEIVKGWPSLFVLMLILKDRSHMFASETDTIPQVPISDISFETPNEYPGWYSAHQRLLIDSGTEEAMVRPGADIAPLGHRGIISYQCYLCLF
jgi:hypothetical protein